MASISFRRSAMRAGFIVCPANISSVNPVSWTIFGDKGTPGSCNDFPALSILTIRPIESTMTNATAISITTSRAGSRPVDSVSRIATLISGSTGSATSGHSRNGVTRFNIRTLSSSVPGGCPVGDCPVVVFIFMIYLLVGGWPTETFSIQIPTSKTRLQPDAILLLTRKIDLPLFPIWIHAKANGKAIYRPAVQ